MQTETDLQENPYRRKDHRQDDTPKIHGTFFHVKLIYMTLNFGFRYVLFFQEIVDALFQRRQIIRDAPRHFLSIRGEFNAADQVWRGLEPDVDVSREGFVDRILYRRALFRRQVQRARTSAGADAV